MLKLCLLLSVSLFGHAAAASAQFENHVSANDRKLVALFNSAQTQSAGVKLKQVAINLCTLATDGLPQHDLVWLREQKREGTLLYVGIYGPVNDRTVRMLCFLNMETTPKDEVVGGLKKVRGWYYTYKEAQDFAGSILGNLGGQGVKGNAASGKGGVKVSYEEMDDKIVSIVLSPEKGKSKPDFKDEKAWESLFFVWW